MAPQRDGRQRWTLWLGLAALLAAPRVARLLYPQIWIEDDAYVHGAFLLSRGWLPYRDFSLPHFPLLEGMLAALFCVAPASVRTAEIVTQSAAFVGSVLVFLLGHRLRGPLTATVASLVFATSALLFRYHVFEREVFQVVPVLAAVVVTTRAEDDARPGSAVLAGLLLAAALAIKLTAVAAFAGLVVQLLLTRRRRFAATLALTTLVAMAALSASLVAWFGTDFVVQVFVFRAVHATFPSLAVRLDEMRYTMDVSLAFGAAGVVSIAWHRDVRRWMAPLMQLMTGFVGLVALNPTYWAHTGIELLPWLSLTAGYLAASTVEAFRSSTQGRGAALACAAAAIAMLLWVAPIRNLNWEAGDGSVYGFGYRDRRELDAMGAFVRAHSAPDDPVATSAIIAFIANRAEVIPYAEVAGTIDELTEMVRRNGYWRTIATDTDRRLAFWDSVEASRDRMAPRLEAALASQRAAVIINDSADDLVAVPLVHLSPQTLEQHGYTLEQASAHYDGWVRKKRGLEDSFQPPSNRRSNRF